MASEFRDFEQGGPVFPGSGDHERSVMHQHAWGARFRFKHFRRVLLQAGQQARLRQQIKVVRNRFGIALVVKLSEDFPIRYFLPGKRCSQFEQRAKQCGLANGLEFEHVLVQGRIDDGIDHVVVPTRFVGSQRRCAPIRA